MARGDLRGEAGVVATTNAVTLAGVTPTAAGLALLDDATAADQRTTLGLAIGTDVPGLTGGYVPTSQLGSGSATSSTYLRGDRTWAPVSAGIGGSTGSTDNRLLRADGTGGSTLQDSAVTVDDSGNMSGVAGLGVTTIELGHASDTTLSRLSAGDVGIEGNRIYRASGTDVPLTDGGTGASDRRAAAANLWARQVTRVTYLAQGDGFQSERGQPSNLLSSAIGVSGDRIFWRNSSSASSGTPGWTTLPSRHLYTTGGVYMGGVVSWSSFTSVRCYFGARNGSSSYTAGRTAFGSVIWMGFALDTDAGDTTLWMVTSDGSTVSQTNTGLTPTAGGWLFLEWYRLGSTVYWTVANCTDITATSFSSSATGTHTGSMPTGQTIGWQMTATPASGTPSLNVDMAILSVGQY